MARPISARWTAAVSLLALGVAGVGVAYLGSRVVRLEARVDELEATAESAPVQRLAQVGTDRAGPSPRTLQRVVTRVVPSAPSGDHVEGEDAVMTRIDDHLWSDGGRQAIGDVVEEKEEADRERRTERWKRLAEYRTQKAVDSVADQLDLSEQQTEEVTELVSTYMEVRSSRWRKMRGDEDVDIAQVEREYEAAKGEVEQQLVGVLGEDGLELLREEIRSGWR